MKKTLLSNNDVLLNLDFRNKLSSGWPGDLKLYTNNSQEYFFPKTKRVEIKDYFQLERCLYCIDKLNPYADISVGDCYIKDYIDKKGKSNIIIRTKKGLKTYNKYKSLFLDHQINIEDIVNSQGVFAKKENLEFLNIKLSEQKEQSVLKSPFVNKLKQMRAKLTLGKNLNVGSIKRALYKEKILHILNKILAKFHIKNEVLKTRFDKRKIVIFGGGYQNKGAQAMLFTVITLLRQKYPDKEIVVFLGTNPQKIRKLMFIAEKITLKEKLFLLFGFHKNKHHEQLKNLFLNTDLILDISGFALSSQFRWQHNISYILNIILAKKYNIPVILLPQSFGPFNYRFPFNLIFNFLFKLYLKYPKFIFAREKEGITELEKYTSKNVLHNYDLVLTSPAYNLRDFINDDFISKKYNVKPDSVGIIPNMQVYKYLGKDKFIELYVKIINKLILDGKNIYIIRHSTEDLELCNLLKDNFSNKNVFFIVEDLYAQELENIISQLEFIVASRYHSIIHGYKHYIPAVVLGWAQKYNSLLNYFDQSQYLIDCRYNLNLIDILDKITDMEKNITRNKKIIQKKSVFESVEEYL